MKILVSHINFPSQFRRLIPVWVSLGHDVVFLARKNEWHSPIPQGYSVQHYQIPQRISAPPSLHPYLGRLNSSLVEGQACYRSASNLRDCGWYPDVIISHLGFGNGLFLKDCFPKAKRIGLAEWFYNSRNSDVDFFPPHRVSEDHTLQLRVWNSEVLLEMSSLDEIVIPTKWQHSQFPRFIQNSSTIAHEGIDYTNLSLLRSSSAKYPDYLPCTDKIEVLSYVSRTFEDYRGFPQAVECIASLLNSRPNLHVIMVGQDGSSYGPKSHSRSSYIDWAKHHFNLNIPRVHWVGSLQESEYHQILAISDVHLYLTVPFILSWSLLEAMAAGCSIVSCTTPPVLEVLQHDFSALLVDFFDTEALTTAIHSLLNDRSLAHRLSRNARSAASHYSVESGRNHWDRLLFG